MGNYMSCTVSRPAGKAFARGTKVISPSGEIRRLYEPTQAAELMLEAPNYFLADAKSLRIGERLAALSADQVLETGGVYVLFPMKRLNSAVTEADVGAPGKQVAGVGARVLPETGGDTTLNLSGVGEPSELERRLSVCRSSKPLLETIVEEPVCIR